MNMLRQSNELVMSVMLYGAETWTHLAADIAFYMKYQQENAQHTLIHTLIHTYLQCRGAPEIRLANNQRQTTSPSHVPIRSRCTL